MYLSYEVRLLHVRKNFPHLPHVRIHISHIYGQSLWLQSQSLYGSQLITDAKAVEKFLQKPKISVNTMTQSILNKIQFFHIYIPSRKRIQGKTEQEKEIGN
jgi:hypothetical protein